MSKSLSLFIDKITVESASFKSSQRHSCPEAEFLDNSLRSFTLSYSQSPLLKDFTPPLPPPSPPSKRALKLVSNVNIVYGNLKSEISQDYAQKPQQNCTLMNLASAFD